MVASTASSRTSGLMTACQSRTPNPGRSVLGEYVWAGPGKTCPRFALLQARSARAQSRVHIRHLQRCRFHHQRRDAYGRGSFPVEGEPVLRQDGRWALRHSGPLRQSRAERARAPASAPVETRSPGREHPFRIHETTEASLRLPGRTGTRPPGRLPCSSRLDQSPNERRSRRVLAPRLGSGPRERRAGLARPLLRWPPLARPLALPYRCHWTSRSIPATATRDPDLRVRPRARMAGPAVTCSPFRRPGIGTSPDRRVNREHRGLRLPDDLLGHAAEHGLRDASVSVRSYDDEIAGRFHHGGQDFLGG